MSATLILADDNSATRSALAIILARRLGLSVVGEAASANELAWLLREGAPEAGLMILAWDLPGLNCDRGIASLRTLNPRVKIVVMSACGEARAQALAAGADAFVSMGEPPEVLLAVIRAIVGMNENPTPYPATVT